MCKVGGDLYVGGEYLPPSNGRRITKWDGTTWSNLGTGTNGAVGGLATDGSDLFLIGSFGSAGGTVSPYCVIASGVNSAPSTPADSDASADGVIESAAIGTIVGITASASDGESHPLTYRLTDDAGGRFAINATTGVIRTASTALDAETATSHDITVEVSDGSLRSTRSWTIPIGDSNEASPTTPLDADASGNTVSENAAIGTAVGITANASDPDGEPITYSLGDSAGGRFAINAVTGVVTTAAALDYETAHDHTITVMVSDGGFTSNATFTIQVLNVNDLAPTAPVDGNGMVNGALTTAIAGTTVGITAQATDADGDTLTWSLTDDASGRFTIDAASGVVSVTSPLAVGDAGTYTITVQVSDGLHTASAGFSLTVIHHTGGDDPEGSDDSSCAVGSGLAWASLALLAPLAGRRRQRRP